MSGPRLIYSNSGTRPDSAAGGSRHPQTATPDPEPRHPPDWLGVTLSELAVWIGVLALVALCLVVGGL